MAVLLSLALMLCVSAVNGEYSRPRREPPTAYGPPRQMYGPPKPRYGPPPKPVYGLPKPKYGPPKMRYSPPKPTYGLPKPIYGPPKPVYGPPKRKYINPPQANFGYQYSPPRKHQYPKYRPVKSSYGPPKSSYGPPASSYGVPLYKKPSFSVPDTYNSQTNTYDAPISISDNYKATNSFSSYTPSQNYGTAMKISTSYGTPAASYGTPSQSSPYNTYTTKGTGSYPIPSTTYGIPSPTYGAPQAPAIAAAASSHNPAATSYISVYKGTPNSAVSTDNYGAPTKGIYDTLSASTNQNPYQPFTQTRFPQQQYHNQGASDDNSRDDDIITSASQNANLYNLQKVQEAYNDKQKDQSTKLTTSIRFPVTPNDNADNESSQDENSQNTASQSNVIPQQFNSFQPPSQTFGFVPYDDSKQKTGREETFSITPSQSYYAGSSVSSEVLPANYYDAMKQQYSRRSDSRKSEETKQSVRFPEEDSKDVTM